MAEWNFKKQSVDFSSELNHYGVIGMKWGIRRYQPYPKGYKGDDEYAKEGERLSKKEWRADKKAAREIGRSASMAGSTYEQASKRYDKMKAKGANPNKLEAARRAKETAKAVSDYMDQRAVEHHRELVKKYGAERVTDIKRGKNGIINEKVADSKAVIGGILKTVGGTIIGNIALTLAGAPVRVYSIEVPRSRTGVGKAAAKRQYKKEYKNVKRGIVNG